MGIALRILVIAIASTITAQALAQGSAGPRLDPAQLKNQLEEARRQRERLESPDIRTALPSQTDRGDIRPLLKLRAVIVEGARTISSEQIAEVYRPFIGRSVSSRDLEEIARMISELYREAGYHLSRAIVPAQDIKNGDVRIKIIEGRFSEIELKGSKVAHAERILGAITREDPARLPTLERHLLLINDLPGHRVADTVIEEIGVATGKFRLIVQIETWRVYSSVGLDNFGVPAVGRLLSYFSTALNSPTGAGDVLGLNISAVPDTPRELSFGQLWYDAPIGNDGARFAIAAAYGEIEPSDERRLRGTLTKSEIFEARISTVPLRTRRSSLWFTASASFNNISETETTGAIYDDRLRTIAIKADYQVQDSTGGWNYMTLGLRQGLDIFDASRQGDVLLSRSDGSAAFSKIEFAFSRLQKLNEYWSVRFASAGQWASRPLLGSQEFNLGGRVFGLGFDTGLITGDHGIGGILELRLDQKSSNKNFNGYQLYAFLDGGIVRNIRPGEDWVGSISSAGLGARFYFPDDMQAEIGIAVPLSRPSTLGIGHNPRIFFLFSKSFRTCPGETGWRCAS